MAMLDHDARLVNEYVRLGRENRKDGPPHNAMADGLTTAGRMADRQRDERTDGQTDRGDDG